jgi:hypothetical protein
MTGAKFELWQDGIPVATVSAPVPGAAREIMHYAAVYGQDGPVEIKRVTRETLTPEQVAVLAYGLMEEPRTRPDVDPLCEVF